jgi:hypothetical protein
MTNSVITFEGPDKAHHSAYGVTIGRTSKEAHISSAGSYEDDLVKRDGQWLIQYRRLEQLPPFVPGAPPPPK